MNEAMLRNMTNQELEQYIRTVQPATVLERILIQRLLSMNLLRVGATERP